MAAAPQTRRVLPRALRVLRSRAARTLLVVAVALLAAGTAMAGLGGVRHGVGPVEVELSLVPALDGGVRIDVPPLGELAMDTHTAPLELRADVQDIRLDDARALLSAGTSADALVDQVTADVRAGVVQLVLRSTLVALLAAALACAVVFRRVRAVAVGTAATAAALVASAGLVGGTARPAALTEPTFTGLLTQAPTLIGSAQDIGARFGEYSAQVTKLTTNVTQLYTALSTLPVGMEDDDIRVLWVSDIHDNPETFVVLPSLVQQFDVSAVVDTGDISDQGLAAENQIYAPIADLPVPYLWIRGNHDSLVTQEYLASLPNVVVLDEGATAEVAGLRWAGTGDPQFTPGAEVELDEQAIQPLMTTAGREVADAVRAAEAAGAPVDVALVHRRTMAGPLYGVAPLVLDGHTHRRSSTVVDGTLKLTQGSSGGAGLRTLEGGAPKPLQMSVLHFDAEDRELLAVDDITIGGLGERSVTVERHTAESYLLAADGTGAEEGGEQPSPTPTPIESPVPEDLPTPWPSATVPVPPTAPLTPPAPF